MKKSFKLTTHLLLLSAVAFLALGPSMVHAQNHSKQIPSEAQVFQQVPAHPFVFEPGLNPSRIGSHLPNRTIAKRSPADPTLPRRVLNLKSSPAIGKNRVCPVSLSSFTPQKFQILRI